MLVLIMTKKASPLVALIVVPVVTGIISCFFIAVVPEGAAEGTQGVVDFVANFKSLGDMITGSKGIGSVAATGVMFIFSILFFGILTDAGTFRPIIKGILNLVGTDPVKIGIGTAILAAVVHLDGSGAVTFLICVPALLPLYDALGMRRTTLATIVALSAGTMNILPWGGPTMRSASVLGIEANDLWIQLMPMQAVGIVIALVTAFVWGNIEKRRGAGVNSTLVIDYGDSDDTGVSQEHKNELARPQFFWVNLILTLVVILALVFVKIPSYCTFMIGCVIALFVNYPGAKMQNKIIKSHSSAGLMMASTILAAGVFLGVLEQSGIMNHMANVLASFIPTSMGRFLPIIIGVLSVPLTLLFCTDSYFYGLLPVLISVGDAFGVDPAHTAIAMVVCRNCATFISPVVPATFLGVGLAGVEIKDHIKNSFFWIWGVSICCLISGLLLGVIVL